MVPHREGKVNRVGDMNGNGAATRHRPVSVDFAAPTAVTVGRVQASRAAGAAARPWLWVVAAAAGTVLGASRMRR